MNSGTVYPSSKRNMEEHLHTLGREEDETGNKKNDPQKWLTRCRAKGKGPSCPGLRAELVINTPTLREVAFSVYISSWCQGISTLVLGDRNLEKLLMKTMLPFWLYIIRLRECSGWSVYQYFQDCISINYNSLFKIIYNILLILHRSAQRSLTL